MSSRVTRFNVPIPTATEDRRQGRLTAYAFNSDRVKTKTVGVPYQLAPTDSRRRPRAYIINIGVDRYQDGRNLEFATKDAEDLGQLFKALDGHDVIPVALLSKRITAGVAAPQHATKSIIKAAIRALAGDERLRASLSGVGNANRLRLSTPDDVVVISFSGHGIADDRGMFYLVPSDTGPRIPSGALPIDRYISTAELRDWLRDVDASQLVLVIDACYSAGSIDSNNFKPGPMGDRTLGQLAYDKAMRVLAATQASDLAIESGRAQQGLLTLALRRALEPAGAYAHADTDQDHQVTIAEWLRYGLEATPSLYQDAMSGRLRASSRSVSVPIELLGPLQNVQTPALFDFSRRLTDIVLRQTR